MSEELLQFLTAAANVNYGRLPIPCDRDFQILTWLTGLDQELLRSPTFDQANTLLAFAERAASWAVRTGGTRLILGGLSAVGVAAPASDPRNVVVALSLLHRACELNGADPRLVFSEAVGSFKERVQDLFQSFLDRSPRDKSIEAMGFSEAMDDTGFLFRCDW